MPTSHPTAHEVSPAISESLASSPSERLWVGALTDRPPGARYAQSLRFAEIAPRPPLPRPATLRRWRRSLPEGFRLALRAPWPAWHSARGPLRLEEEDLQLGLQWLRQAQRATGAELLVVATGAAVTTGRRDRDRLIRYFEALHDLDCTLVWAPDGLWRLELAAPQAERMGVLCALDPLEDPLPEAERAYARLQAIGVRARFGEELLWQLAERLQRARARTLYLSLESSNAFRDALRLMRLLQSPALAGGDEDAPFLLEDSGASELESDEASLPWDDELD